MLQHEFPHWPLVGLDRPRLVEHGICDANTPTDKPVSFWLFNRDMKDWTEVKEGYQLKVASGERVYVRHLAVESAPGFDLLLAKDPHSQPAATHMRHNLPAERASIRQQRDTVIVAAAPPPAHMRQPSAKASSSQLHAKHVSRKGKEVDRSQHNPSIPGPSTPCSGPSSQPIQLPLPTVT